ITSFKCGDKELLTDDSYNQYYKRNYETQTPDYYYQSTPTDSYEQYTATITPDYEVTTTAEYYSQPTTPIDFTGVIDSGSVQFRFPSKILKKINKEIGAVCSEEEPDYCTVDCNTASSLPDFTISFDLKNGKSVTQTITPSDYILPASDSYSQCVSGFSGYGCSSESYSKSNKNNKTDYSKKRRHYKEDYENTDYENKNYKSKDDSSDYNKYDDYKDSDYKKYDDYKDSDYKKYDDYKDSDYKKYDDYSYNTCQEPDQQIVIGGVFFKSRAVIFYSGKPQKTYTYTPPPPEKPKGDECLAICVATWEQYEVNCSTNPDHVTW
ncbi:hypothetical protein HK096_007775, partial [Nowakowskiella sp. JEL0078]